YSNSSATYVYSLSLHDALPIYIFLVHNSYFPDHRRSSDMNGRCFGGNHAISFTFNMIGVDFHAEYSHFIWIDMQKTSNTGRTFRDRKSTRLNYSHVSISYAVFC